MARPEGVWRTWGRGLGVVLVLLVGAREWEGGWMGMVGMVCLLRALKLRTVKLMRNGFGFHVMGEAPEASNRPGRWFHGVWCGRESWYSVDFTDYLGR